MKAKLLDVTGLTISFPTEGGPFIAVRDLDLAVAPGETVAVVGESGSGKSVTALAITRLIDYAGGRITGRRRSHYTDRAGASRDLVREPPRGDAAAARRPRSRWCSRSR